MSVLLTRIVRWPAPLIVLLVGLAILYRYGPHRRPARWRWVGAGSIFASVVWIGTFSRLLERPALPFSARLAKLAKVFALYGLRQCIISRSL
jgi:Virulence factor BrkB